MADEPLELLQGTLDVLILKTLTWGPTHGYGVAHSIRQKTIDELRIDDGALYTSLHRLEQRKWVRSDLECFDHRRFDSADTAFGTIPKMLRKEPVYAFAWRKNFVAGRHLVLRRLPALACSR